jgi:hypothetical protein
LLIPASQHFASRLLAAQPGFLDAYPGVWQLMILAAAGVLIAIMVRYWRGPSATLDGFVIRVDGDDVSFRGQFPPQMEAIVTDFLRNDVAVTDPYEIRGRWEERILVVIVNGDAARPMEQRIRNFLKLNIKKPR